MLNWANAAGFAALLAVALAGSLHFALYYSPPRHCPPTSEQQSNISGTPETEERQRDQDQKSATERGLLWFTAMLAVATIALVVATVGLVFFAKTQIEDSRINQRAYVRMSHGPPGIDVKVNTGLLYINMGIKNFGNTPANITDIMFKVVVMSPKNAPLPTIPDYSSDRTVFPKAFLVSQEEFFIFHILRIAPEEIISVRDWSADLYIIGFVDYIDKFGDRHRGGYARKYAVGRDDRPSYEFDEQFAKRNNLIFVTEAGYNYDGLRISGEGDDWNQKA